MPKGTKEMKGFLSDCLDYYANFLVQVLFLPLMIVTIPIAMIAVCLTVSYRVIDSMFETNDE